MEIALKDMKLIRESIAVHQRFLEMKENTAITEEELAATREKQRNLSRLADTFDELILRQ